MKKHDEEARVDGYGVHFVRDKNYFAHFVFYTRVGLCNRRDLDCGPHFWFLETGSIARRPG